MTLEERKASLTALISETEREVHALCARHAEAQGESAPARQKLADGILKLMDRMDEIQAELQQLITEDLRS